MGTQMIYKFMTTILPMKYPSSPNVSLILFTSWTIWFRAIWLGFGTFDPIVINGETISHTVRDLGVYIDSSINLADHVHRLTTRTCSFKFVNLDLSIHCSLSNFLTPCAMVLTSLNYCNGLLGGKPWEVSHQSVIWRVRKGTVRHWLDISAKNAFKICELAHPCLRGSAPPYLIPHASDDIPGRTFAHLRSAAVGMLKYPGLGHRLWQSDPGNFAISSPSAWNFLQVDLHDPGFSFITLDENSRQFCLVHLPIHLFIKCSTLCLYL